MTFDYTEVYGFEHAIRGMRNPLESWDKSDSERETHSDYEKEEVYTKFAIGKNDLELMQRLIKAGSEHRKFMRQIFVFVDITAPLYWWKEFDTYKVGTVANSTSTMHKLASTPITMDCFEMDDFEEFPINKVGEKIMVDNGYLWKQLIDYLELLRQKYLESKDRLYWKELIRLLPESWLQTRTVTMNYENLLSMVNQRKKHKLTEWSIAFLNWAKTLPYAQELLF